MRDRLTNWTRKPDSPHVAMHLTTHLVACAALSLAIVAAIS